MTQASQSFATGFALSTRIARWQAINDALDHAHETLAGAHPSQGVVLVECATTGALRLMPASPGDVVLTDVAAVRRWIAS